MATEREPAELNPVRRSVRLRAVRKAGVLALGVLLAAVGVYNIVQKSTWSVLDDGVYWEVDPIGVRAGRVAEAGPGERAGVRAGDVLQGIDGESVMTPGEVEARLRSLDAGAALSYSLLRAEEARILEVQVAPLPSGNLSLFYYLSTVGFFSLIVGTIVVLRRPRARGVLHFYAVCVLFFLVYSLSYTGRLDVADWLLLGANSLATLFLPAVFLHFCLTFPERRGARFAALAYLPGLVLAGAAFASHALFVVGPARDAMWEIAGLIDRAAPLYFAALFCGAFGVLVHSYRRSLRAVARKQTKWLVWGTGLGVAPFLLFYAIPFALGTPPGLLGETLSTAPLALIPLTLAYAVVKHRLRDVELIFRRSLVYTLATASTVGVCLAFIALFDRIAPSNEDVHSTIIAVLCALIVILLFTPVKTRIQEAVDRLFYGERYQSRKALLRLSHELNSEIDLGRVTERLIEGVANALGVRAIAIFLPREDGSLAVFRSQGCREETQRARLPDETEHRLHLADGAPLTPEELPAEVDETMPELAYFFPCPAREELIAVLAVGRRDDADADPLNSEEIDLLRALAGQAATAFMNGRLYRRLHEKAEELQRLKDYNESILESIDSGIVVSSLEGRVEHWNRSMELLYGRARDQVLGRDLDEVFPRSFMEALRSSLVFGREEEIAHIYKLHLPAADGRNLRVDVSVAPFRDFPGQRCGSILILEDVTARVRLEEQLQHSEKMASIGLLAAGVAHEVNTPLAGISSYTQMALGQLEADNPAVALLERIEKQSFRAAKIVNSLLNFSRSGGVELASVSLNKIVLDVLSLLEHQFEGSRVKIRRELAEGLPPVPGDENRLQQVFFNLMLNARDAMPRGGWLTLCTRLEEDAVVLEVGDTGCGIRSEDVRRIYDPFFTTKGIGRGTGLGLSVSYGIVQEHGGRIAVDTAPGKGSTFRDSLPNESIPEAVAQR